MTDDNGDDLENLTREPDSAKRRSQRSFIVQGFGKS